MTTFLKTIKRDIDLFYFVIVFVFFQLYFTLDQYVPWSAWLGTICCAPPLPLIIPLPCPATEIKQIKLYRSICILFWDDLLFSS